MKTSELLKRLNKLEPLDLSKRHTISEIVEGMEKTAFSARSLGKVIRKIFEWTEAGDRPYIVADHLSRPLRTLINKMCDRPYRWFRGIHSSSAFLSDTSKNKKAVVIGNYNEATAESLHESTNEMIFINQYYRAKPGQVRDGYFPDVVFADPNYIVPILYLVLRERKGEQASSVEELVSWLQEFPGLAMEFVRGAITLDAMTKDKRCTRFLTLAGAMTIAKMQLVCCDMLEKLDFHYVASTGALMAHGFIEGTGDTHYEYDPAFSDDILAKHGMNRITDAIEPEINFDHLDEIMNEVLDGFSGKREISPSMIHRAMGKYHKKYYPDCRGILRTAFERNIPVIVPAFHDSEIGNDVFVHNLLRKRARRKKLIINQELDSKVLLDLMANSDRPGIFSVGGGSPRNYTQNVAPLTEIINARNAGKLPIKKFFYGCKIDPAPLVYGNLGSATYEEMQSWRKAALNGMFASIHTCATITWPFLVKYAMAKA